MKRDDYDGSLSRVCWARRFCCCPRKALELRGGSGRRNVGLRASSGQIGSGFGPAFGLSGQVNKY